MSARLPPLNALRAFEVAARHLSFKRAAEELSVTPAAISHQIAGLERHLGVLLFRRRARSIELTDEARRCLPRLQDGFLALAQAVEVLRPDEGSALTVSVAPSFASRWLMPRLHRFVTAHPEVDVRVSARMRHVSTPGAPQPSERASIDAWLSDADVAIVLGTGSYPDLNSRKLLSLALTPLCSPKLLEGRPPLERPDDLRHFLLLHDDTGYFFNGRAFWDIWLRAAGATQVDAGHGPHFSHAVLALEAAIDGIGVVVSMPILAEPDLGAGRLVTPFALRVPLSEGYHLVCNESAAVRPKVKAFSDWLILEAGRDANAHPKLLNEPDPGAIPA